MKKKQKMQDKFRKQFENMDTPKPKEAEAESVDEPVEEKQEL
jgi:hypothetical protein